jgi:opacity protein-like surface antigen
MKRAIRTILAVFLIVIGVGKFNEVRADPLALSSFNDSEWRVDFSPYIFLPYDVSGDSTIAGQTASFDLDTSDILDLLSFALSGRLEAWKGDFGLILDGYYVNLDAGGDTDTPGPLPINVGVNIDIRQYIVDALGSYRAINQPYNAEGDMWSLDLMAGLRYNYLRQVVDLEVSGPGPGGATSLGGSVDWVDPIVGARAVMVLNDRWAAGLRGDIGGFGVSDADLQWSVTGGFDYRPWETTSIKFGWRYYSIDMATSLSDGAFAYDVTQHGPYVAMTFRFQ